MKHIIVLAMIGSLLSYSPQITAQGKSENKQEQLSSSEIEKLVTSQRWEFVPRSMTLKTGGTEYGLPYKYIRFTPEFIEVDLPWMTQSSQRASRNVTTLNISSVGSRPSSARNEKESMEEAQKNMEDANAIAKAAKDRDPSNFDGFAGGVTEIKFTANRADTYYQAHIDKQWRIFFRLPEVGSSDQMRCAFEIDDKDGSATLYLMTNLKGEITYKGYIRRQ